MKIEIRHAEPSDAEAIRAIHASSGTFSETLQLPCPPLSLWTKRLEERPSALHSYVASLDGEVVGHIGIMTNADKPRRKHAAEIGMGVRDDCWGKGVGSALLAFAIDVAENWLNLSRIELSVFSDNGRAIALYEKHGFEREGEMREYAFRNGRYVDAVMMARLREPLE